MRYNGSSESMYSDYMLFAEKEHNVRLSLTTVPIPEKDNYMIFDFFNSNPKFFTPVFINCQHFDYSALKKTKAV